jgi:hypothetical protein
MAGTTTTTLTPKSLIASDTYGPVLIQKTVVSGANVARGTIMGRITATGKMKAYASGSSDGSQVPIAVLMEDAAAASADAAAICAFAGVFIEANMTGLDAAAKLSIEARGLYFI